MLLKAWVAAAVGNVVLLDYLFKGDMRLLLFDHVPFGNKDVVADDDDDDGATMLSWYFRMPDQKTRSHRADEIRFNCKGFIFWTIIRENV